MRSIVTDRLVVDELVVDGQEVVVGAGATGATGPTGSTGATGSDGVSAFPTGMVMMWGGTDLNVPSGWVRCDGEPISRTTYAALFAVIGTAYGAGDGSTTFNTPNTGGVFVRGVGVSTIGGLTYSGFRGTSETDQIQGHYHQTYSPTAAGGSFVWGMQAWTNNRSPTLSPTGDQGSREAITGNYGTLRQGTETRPANISMYYIIKT